MSNVISIEDELNAIAGVQDFSVENLLKVVLKVAETARDLLDSTNGLIKSDSSDDELKSILMPLVQLNLHVYAATKMVAEKISTDDVPRGH